MIDFFVKNKIQKIKELFGMNIKPNPNNEKYFFISVPEIKSRGNKPGFFIVKSSDLEPAFFDLDGSMVNEPVLDGNNNITFKDFLKISEENTLKRSEGVSKAKVQKGTKVIKAETLEELLEMPSVIRVLNFLSYNEKEIKKEIKSILNIQGPEEKQKQKTQNINISPNIGQP